MGWFDKKKKEVDPNEHRRAERVAIFEVTEVFSTGDQQKVVMKDISLSGVRFSTPQPMAAQTVLKVRIDYNPIDFPLKAIVVWARQVSDNEWDHGAEFVNIPQDEKNLLADHLETLKAAIAAQDKPDQE